MECGARRLAGARGPALAKDGPEPRCHASDYRHTVSIHLTFYGHIKPA